MICMNALNSKSNSGANQQLLNLSPLDGRYASKLDSLRPLLSEAGFMKHRVEVEVAWLVGLSDLGLAELPTLAPLHAAR